MYNGIPLVIIHARHHPPKPEFHREVKKRTAGFAETGVAKNSAAFWRVCECCGSVARKKTGDGLCGGALSKSCGMLGRRHGDFYVDG